VPYLKTIFYTWVKILKLSTQNIKSPYLNICSFLGQSLQPLANYGIEMTGNEVALTPKQEIGRSPHKGIIIEDTF